MWNFKHFELIYMYRIFLVLCFVHCYVNGLGHSISTNTKPKDPEGGVKTPEDIIKSPTENIIGNPDIP